MKSFAIFTVIRDERGEGYGKGKMAQLRTALVSVLVSALGYQKVHELSRHSLPPTSTAMSETVCPRGRARDKTADASTSAADPHRQPLNAAN